MPAGVIGLAGVLSDTGPMRPVLGGLALASILGVGGAIHTVFDVVRAGREEGARLREAANPSVGDGPAGSPATHHAPAHDAPQGDVIGRWSLTGGEAGEFATRAWARRKREVPGVAAAVFVLGSGVLLLTEDGPAWAAFAAGAFLGGLYLTIGLAKYGMEYHAAIRTHDDIVVWLDAIFVLGTHHSLERLSAVKLTDDVLLLTITWETRGGIAEDTLTVPVPAHARAMAAEVVRVLQQRLA